MVFLWFSYGMSYVYPHGFLMVHWVQDKRLMTTQRPTFGPWVLRWFAKNDGLTMTSWPEWNIMWVKQRHKPAIWEG